MQRVSLALFLVFSTRSLVHGKRTVHTRVQFSDAEDSILRTLQQQAHDEIAIKLGKSPNDVERRCVALQLQCGKTASGTSTAKWQTERKR